MKLRFAAWKVVGQLCLELSPKEAHSEAYHLQHEEVNVRQNPVRAMVKDLRAHGLYSDHLMLFENLSAKGDSEHNTI